MPMEIAIRAPTENECAILDISGGLAAGMPSVVFCKCSISINLVQSVFDAPWKR
jgi:hypothetical protein